MNKETLSVHAGERAVDRGNRSITIPIEQTAAYYFNNTDQIIDFYNGKVKGVKYGRYGCPTQHAVEAKLAELEGAERSLLFSSGMSALTSTILTFVKKNQHILYVGECYRNTRKFFKEILPQFSIESTEIPLEHINDIEKYCQDNTTLFFAEAPTNPFLHMIDIPAVVKNCRKKGIISIIDATLASPINLQPIKSGVDLVIHSATKYLGGHHDLFAGTVSGNFELLEAIQEARDIYGGIIDPHTSYLLLRSLQTLAIRMEFLNRNGEIIAKYLKASPYIDEVWYPSISSHSDCIKGAGGMISFTLKASESHTSQFIDNLKIPYIGSNFGGPQSIVEQHAILTFFRERDEASQRNINGNFIRYSVGFENTNDVIEDFERAFHMVFNPSDSENNWQE